MYSAVLEMDLMLRTYSIGGSSRKGYVYMHIYLLNFQLKVKLSDSSMMLWKKNCVESEMFDSKKGAG